MDTSIIKASLTEQDLAELREKYAIVPKVTDRKSLEAVKKEIAIFRKYRGEVKRAHKIGKEEALDHCRKVDACKRYLDEELFKMENPRKDAVKAYEAQIAAKKAEKERLERERVTKIQAEIQSIRSIPLDLAAADSKVIGTAIGKLTYIPDYFDYQEFKGESNIVKQNTLEALSQLQDTALAREDAQRKAEEEKKRLEAERLKLEKERAELEEAKAKAEIDEFVKSNEEAVKDLEKVIDETPTVETEDTVETVTITKSEYDQLLRDQCMLQALIEAEVEYWDGFEAAMAAMEKEER